MNSTIDTRNNTFNAPSRATIYRNVRRVADPSWQWDYEEFVGFDIYSTPTSAAKGAGVDMDTPIIMPTEMHVSPFSRLQY